MALRYRHDPPSFKLTKDLLRDVYTAKGQFSRYIFGYTVLFTDDKINKLQQMRLRPHSFRTFQKSFFEFLNRQNSTDRNAAQSDFKMKKRKDKYAEPGEYDKDGNFLSKFPSSVKENNYKNELKKEEDRYADNAETWKQYWESLSPEEKAFYAKANIGSEDGTNFDRKEMDPFKYQTDAQDETGESLRRAYQKGEQDQSSGAASSSSTRQDHSSTGADASYRERKKENETQGQERQEKERERHEDKDKKRHDRNRKERQDQKDERKTKSSSEDKGKGKEKDKDTDKQDGKQTEESSPPASTKPAPKTFRLRNFNLSSLQRPKDMVETHVPVKRGDYNKVRSSIIEGDDGGYVITGPTGCGKSTVALLKLFSSRKTRVLVVEPTQANAANIEHEFRHILPNLVTRIPSLGEVPDVAFRALTTAREPLPQLVVTTTEKVLEYFNYYGQILQFDYLVLDEFHLPIEDMVEMVELMRTFNVAKKYILVSATAEGFKVNAQLPPAVTRIQGVLPVGEIPAQLEGSDLDPRVWADRADGTYGVVAPSVTMAHTLYRQYKDWGVRTFLITRNTYASDYLKAVKNYSSRTAFVLEPGVEAGVTLSVAVLVSMGATMAVRYDGDVVIEDIQPLSAIAAIQRGGRGGRVVPTLYVEPEAPKDVAAGSSADYYRARAIIKMIALGARTEGMRDNGIFATFPRLKTVTRELALAALEAGGDPFISIYRHNDAGQVYVECGGNGGGFSRLAEQELKLYYWPAGFYVAPITDFSRLNSEPDTFVLRSHQLRAARTMVEAIPGLADRYPLGELVNMLIAKIDIYVNDLFGLLKSIFIGDKPGRFSLRGRDYAPTLADFLGSAPEVLKLFNHMATEPAGIKFVRKVEVEDGVHYSEHSFEYSGKQLNFSFPADYTAKGTVDVEKLSREVYAKLQHILAVEILVNGAPEKCVDLMKYKDRVSREHVWFTRVREHSSKVNLK